MTELTDSEAQHIIELKEQIRKAGPKQLRHIRRTIRNRIFRMRQGRSGFDNGLRKFIEAQLNPDQDLATFTHNWDISPRDPLTVISPFEWESSGGKFEALMVPDDNGIPRKVMVCDPAAFTQQDD